MEAVGRPEFLINGLRNRDVRALLYTTPASTKAEERRRSAAIGRKLRLLRGHGLIRKVPKTHRNQVSDNGRTVMTAPLAARRQRGFPGQQRSLKIGAPREELRR